jgi:hypothetical protein
MIPVIKRRLRWTEHMVDVVRRNTVGVLFRYAHGKNHLHGLEVDGSVILKQILKLQDVEMWTGFIWLRTGTNGGC